MDEGDRCRFRARVDERRVQRLIWRYSQRTLWMRQWVEAGKADA